MKLDAIILPCLLSAVLILVSPTIYGQWISDPCMSSANYGPDFPNSNNLANTSTTGSDLIVYQDGAWGGLNTSENNGVSIQPPVDCFSTRAVFMKVLSSDEHGQGVGFKLNESFTPGSTVSFEFTYVSHGTGATGTFQPILYTHSNSNFFDSDGQIQATWAKNCPTVGTTWETITVSWNVNAFIQNHNWLWFYAPENSGILLNLCQVGVAAPEFPDFQPIHICEGESVTIGEDFGDQTFYSWSDGSTSPFIEVSSSGSYLVQASNACNNQWGQYVVQVHGPPELSWPESEILLCEGDSMVLSTEGLNPVNSWPDGSSSETWTANEEGIFNLSVTDDCFTSEYEITVDYDTIPNMELGPDLALCEGQTYELDGTAVGWTDVEYLWNTGETSPLWTVTYQGTFQLTASNWCGSYSDSVFVEYSLIPDSILPEEIFLCTGRDYLFDVSHIDAFSYTWSDGSNQATLLTQYTGPYWIEIVDDDFCFIVHDTVWVYEGACECPLYLPNAFTPDYDGLNDVFSPQFECDPYDFTMEIYDRWGSVAFRTNNVYEGWNGRFDGVMAPQSTYHWRIWYRESYAGIPIEKFGSVTVLGHPYGNQ